MGERIRGELQRKVRDELLDRDILYTLQEVQKLTEQYRQTYNRIRPQNSLRVDRQR